MVFTQLGAHEKEAFFDLLDEYFSSRPELLSSLGGPSSSHTSASQSTLSPNTRAAASAVHSALAANPEATASLVSAGLRHGSQNSSVKNSSFANAAANPEIANSIGRVAAASLAFGNKRNTPPPPPAPASHARPVLPRRTSSSTPSVQDEEEEEASPVPGRPPLSQKSSGASGLQQKRAFGDVDTSSFKSGFLSIRHGTANKNKPPPAVAPPLPPAFPKKKHNFAPPPTRRLTSDASPARSSEPEPEPEPEEEVQEEGEWAEALYDYNSGESGDLVLRANQHVKILSKDSDDWWTGEVDGRSGLLPASYVKML